MKKIISILLTAVILSFSFFGFTAYMYDGSYDDYKLNAKREILINLDTGRVIYENNADEQCSIASLTKILTAMTVIDNCKDLDAVVEAKYDDLLTIGNTGLVTVNLKSGEKMSVNDMLHCLLIASAADASVVLADYIGGSIDKFIDMMNEEAAKIGMADSHFVNTHGIDAADHYSTARDMALLTQYALKNELFTEIVGNATYTIPATNLSEARNLKNTNYLLIYDSGFFYQYAKGVKTGYTGDAGRCLIATAEKDGMNYLAVILGCDDFKDNGEIACNHFADAIYLFENAFSDYSVKTTNRQGDKVGEIHDKAFGIDTDVEAVLNSDFSYLVKKGEKVETETVLDYEELSGIVEKGAKLGICKIILDGREIGQVDVVAGNDVTRDFGKMAVAVLKIAGIVLGVLIVLAVIIVIIRKKPSGGHKMKRNVKYQ